MNESRYISIKDLYPQHHTALENTGLALAYIPMLQKVLNLKKSKEKHKEEKLEWDKQRNRSIYFCIVYSKFWKEPVHKWLKN
jgi:hypothetical protein